MHTVLSSALLALALTGCATAGAPSSGGSGGDLNLISSEQLRQPELESRSAWEIIERLRPRWFQSRGSVFTSGQIFARVMVDGVPSGELNDLQSMSASGIEEMRYLNARDATTRFGTGYDGCSEMKLIHPPERPRAPRKGLITSTRSVCNSRASQGRACPLTV